MFQGSDITTRRFRYFGESIHENDTPSFLSMEDGDTIDVYKAQGGGPNDVIGCLI